MTRISQRFPLEVSVHSRYQHQDAGKSCLEKAKMWSYRKYSKATICKHMKKSIVDLAVDKKEGKSRAATNTISSTKQNIIRQTKILQEETENFCVKRIKFRATICKWWNNFQVLKKAAIKWTHAQKKEILSKNDLKLKLKFAWKVRRMLPKNFWTEGIGFYLDGTSFTHKTNPFDQVRALKSIAWRRPDQGLDFGYTANWSHEETGRSVAHFMAAIAYGKGLIGAEQYHGRINAEKFSSFIREHFASMFKKSANPRGKLFLQDDDP